MKMPSIPYSTTGKVSRNAPKCIIFILSYDNKPIIRPPAIADAICPATLALTACMSRKLLLSSSRPILWMTRADMGNAGNPRCADHWIDFMLGEKVQHLCKQYAAHRVKDKGYKPQPHD